MKDFLKKYWSIIALIGVLIAFLFSIESCSTWKERYKACNNNITNNFDSSFYKQKIDNLKRKVVTQEQNIHSKQSKIKELEEKKSQLKDLKKTVKVVTETKYKKDTIKTTDTVYNCTDNDISLLRIPYSFGVNKKFYSYGFTIDSSGNVIQDSLSFKTDLNIYWGREDHGWFKNIYKTNKPVVRIISSNPELDYKKVSNRTFKDFRESNISFSLQAGYGFTIEGLSPYVGLGVDYNIANFKL